jgi:putative PIN family toxin of toxin-antitoxin system
LTIAVVDTNVLVSGLVRARGDSPPTRILDLWRREVFVLAISAHIRTEVARTLASPYFATRVDPKAHSNFINDLSETAMSVLLIRTVSGVATQPKDDPVLATALNANADYLVTGDKALLNLGTFEGTRIVTAADFVAIVEAS